MVVDELSEQEADRLFHALADSTRRDILRRSVSGNVSVSRLAELYPMSFAAVQKHVTVLERAGLITKVHRGRERHVRSEPEALERARWALEQIEEAWRERIDRMKQVLEADRDAEETRNHQESTDDGNQR